MITAYALAFSTIKIVYCQLVVACPATIFMCLSMLLRILINPMIISCYGDNDSGDADDGGADHDVTQVQFYCSTSMADRRHRISSTVKACSCKRTILIQRDSSISTQNQWLTREKMPSPQKMQLSSDNPPWN